MLDHERGRPVLVRGRWAAGLVLQPQVRHPDLGAKDGRRDERRPADRQRVADRLVTDREEPSIAPHPVAAPIPVWEEGGSVVVAKVEEATPVDGRTLDEIGDLEPAECFLGAVVADEDGMNHLGHLSLQAAGRSLSVSG